MQIPRLCLPDKLRFDWIELEILEAAMKSIAWQELRCYTLTVVTFDG